MKRLTTIHLLIAAVMYITGAWAQAQETLEPVPFAELPPAVQKMFNDRADEYVWIDQRLWCIEVLRRYQKMEAKYHTPDTLAPYQDPSAPMYYDPVNRESSSTEEYAILKTPGTVILIGQLLRDLPEGLLIRLPDQNRRFTSKSPQALIAGMTRDQTSKRDVRVVARPSGTHTLKVGTKTTEIPIYELAQAFVKPAETHEVYEYFVRHNIDTFPFLVPRATIMMSDGATAQKYEWDNKPIRVDLPPMRTTGKPALRKLLELE